MLARSPSRRGLTAMPEHDLPRTERLAVYMREHARAEAARDATASVCRALAVA